MSQQSNHEPETLEAPADCGYEQEELRLAGEPGACPDAAEFDAWVDECRADDAAREAAEDAAGWPEGRWTLVEDIDQLLPMPRPAVDLSGFEKLADGLENQGARLEALAADQQRYGRELEAFRAQGMAAISRQAAQMVRDELARVKGGA